MSLTTTRKLDLSTKCRKFVLVGFRQSGPRFGRVLVVLAANHLDEVADSQVLDVVDDLEAHGGAGDELVEVHDGHAWMGKFWGWTWPTSQLMYIFFPGRLTRFGLKLS